jgi:hypothetical protein
MSGFGGPLMLTSAAKGRIARPAWFPTRGGRVKRTVAWPTLAGPRKIGTGRETTCAVTVSGDGNRVTIGRRRGKRVCMVLVLFTFPNRRG